MVLPWFFAEKKEGKQVAVVGFVMRVVATTMKCFFGCFRSRDSHSRSNSTPCEPRVSYSNNTLSSLFLSNEDDSLRTGREGLNSLPEELEVKELENEARFLKACGTLVDTPLEIRKASRKWMGTSAPNEEPKSSGFKSRILNSSNEKQPDGSPTYVSTCQEWEDGSGSLAGTPSSCCTSDDQNAIRDSVKSIESCDCRNAITLMYVSNDETYSSNSFVSPEVDATSVQGKHKSVRFECESENSTPSPGSSDQCLKPSFSTCKHRSAKASPNPTPLKLTDDAQTPGTVFPAYMDSMAGGKAGRVRSQYVYSILNPIDCPLHWKELNDENSDPNKGLESLKLDNAAVLPSPLAPGTSTRDLSLGKDWKDGEVSLSPRLKQNSAKHDHSDEQYDSTVGEDFQLGTTPQGSPMETVAAKWNQNGIPNTTNKYREDKQVSWHATPFEVRLEKALFKETFIPQREKMLIGEIPAAELNEYDQESDSASSEQYPSAHTIPDQ